MLTLKKRKLPVDWSKIPTKKELEDYHAATRPRKGKGKALLGFSPPAPQDCLVHKSKDHSVVKKIYEDGGFDTDVVLQDPFGHNCPTTACPIGFPSNLKTSYSELRRYNKWICRIHVEIVRDDGSDKLISVPHIEVDPAFHPLDHLTDTFLLGHVVRGPVAVEILRGYGVV